MKVSKAVIWKMKMVMNEGTGEVMTLDLTLGMNGMLAVDK